MKAFCFRWNTVNVSCFLFVTKVTKLFLVKHLKAL